MSLPLLHPRNHKIKTYDKISNCIKDAIYIEKGISGKKADRRPKFQQMISLAKQKPSPFQIILVWKYSRFARNQEESIVYKSLLRRQCKVEVRSVSEPVVDGPFGSLIERIIEWMDEYYSIRLSGEVTRGMTEKALRGGYQSRPPLGYRIKTRGEPPVIVPEEAKTVQLIFEKFVYDRMGLFDLARYVNALGLKTSHGKAFERRSLEYILQNPTYVGQIRWNRTTGETNEIKDRSTWILAKGQHPAIIQQELFDAAQQRFSTESASKGARPSSVCRHWLSGLLKCPACGRTMVAKKTTDKKYKRTYYYFTCYGYLKGKCLAQNSVSSKKIEPVVLQAVHEATFCAHLRFIRSAKKSETDAKEYDLLQGQLAACSETERRIKTAYQAGIDTLAEYKENKERLAKERRRLKERLIACSPAAFETAAPAKPFEQKPIAGIYDLLLSNTCTAQEKNAALKTILEKIVYQKETDNLMLYFRHS